MSDNIRDMSDKSERILSHFAIKLQFSLNRNSE